MFFLFLKIPHLRIEPVLRQQFAMSTAFDDFPVIHHQYLVRIHNRGQSMSDYQRGAVLRDRAQFGLEQQQPDEHSQRRCETR